MTALASLRRGFARLLQRAARVLDPAASEGEARQKALRARFPEAPEAWISALVALGGALPERLEGWCAPRRAPLASPPLARAARPASGDAPRPARRDPAPAEAVRARPGVPPLDPVSAGRAMSPPARPRFDAPADGVPPRPAEATPDPERVHEARRAPGPIFPQRPAGRAGTVQFHSAPESDPEQHAPRPPRPTRQTCLPDGCGLAPAPPPTAVPAAQSEPTHSTRHPFTTFAAPAPRPRADAAAFAPRAVRPPPARPLAQPDSQATPHVPDAAVFTRPEPPPAVPRQFPSGRRDVAPAAVSDLAWPEHPDPWPALPEHAAPAHALMTGRFAEPLPDQEARGWTA